MVRCQKKVVPNFYYLLKRNNFKSFLKGNLVPFYDLCSFLKNVDIEVGVAIPCVKKYKDDTEVDYQDDTEADYQDDTEADYQDDTEKDSQDDTEADYQDDTEADSQDDTEADYQDFTDYIHTQCYYNNNKGKTYRDIPSFNNRKDIPSEKSESYTSKKFKLIIKSSGKQLKKEKYDQILSAIKLLKICLGIVSYSERIFWKAYGEIKGIDISINKHNSTDLNKILSIMEEANGIQVRDGTSMRCALEIKDHTTRFFLPLDGLNTVKESIRIMLCLKNSELFSGVEWWVGSLGLHEFKSAPFLFVIKNKEIKLVLTDFLDVCILRNGVYHLSKIHAKYDNGDGEIKNTLKTNYGIEEIVKANSDIEYEKNKVLHSNYPNYPNSETESENNTIRDQLFHKRDQLMKEKSETESENDTDLEENETKVDAEIKKRIVKAGSLEFEIMNDTDLEENITETKADMERRKEKTETDCDFEKKGNIFDIYDFDYKKVFMNCLSIETLNLTFNSEKANYALEIYRMLTAHKMKNIEIDESYFKISKNDSKLEELLEIIRFFIRGKFNDSKELFISFKTIATKSDQNIAKKLDKNDLDDVQIRSSEKKLEWEELITLLDKHKRWKIFETSYITNLIDICKISKSKEEQLIRFEEGNKFDKMESTLIKEKILTNNRQQIEVILKRYISSISMNYQNKNEINLLAEKGKFFSVLELLNNSLYNEEFILFNDMLNKIVETDKNNNMNNEIDSIDKLAFKNRFISSNMRYIQYKKSIDEIKNLNCKLKIFLNIKIETINNRIIKLLKVWCLQKYKIYTINYFYILQVLSTLIDHSSGVYQDYAKEIEENKDINIKLNFEEKTDSDSKNIANGAIHVGIKQKTFWLNYFQLKNFFSSNHIASEKGHERSADLNIKDHLGETSLQKGDLKLEILKIII
jgi:hypothetical protein